MAFLHSSRGAFMVVMSLLLSSMVQAFLPTTPATPSTSVVARARESKTVVR